jgi:WD40 repeat protein
MYLLSSLDAHRFRGTYEDPIYVTDLHPVLSGLAAISTDQNLSLFDLTSLRRGPVRTFRTSHGNLTVAKPFDPAQSAVCTAGSDGSVAIWDLRTTGGDTAQVTKQIGRSGHSEISCRCSYGHPTWC